MFLDVLALLLLVLAFFKGLRNGLVVAVFSFLAILVGLAAALKLSALAAGYIGQAVSVSERWLPFLAFAAVFILVVLLVRLAANLLESILQATMLGWANRLGGVLFYVLLYGFIFSVFLFYALQLQLLKPEALEASVSYGWLQPLAPKAAQALGAVFPIFQNAFAELGHFFEGVAENGV